MNKIEYEEKINSLFEKWIIEKGYRTHFVKDGIIGFDQWMISKT